jgi:TRCF domain
MPERPCKHGLVRRFFAPVLAALLFFGALFWAKGRDPFQRVWFKVKVPGQGKVECVAVLPKDSLKSKVQSPKSEPSVPIVVSRVSPPSASPATPASAYIPFRYVSDARQRIEVYRKLAQTTDQAGLRNLEQELRDRFGPVPPPLQLLLQVAELKVLAAECGVTAIEVQADKLMLTRNNDYVMIGSKFPRLTKKQPGARLKEIKQMLLAVR